MRTRIAGGSFVSHLTEQDGLKVTKQKGLALLSLYFFIVGHVLPHISIDQHVLPQNPSFLNQEFDEGRG